MLYLNNEKIKLDKKTSTSEDKQFNSEEIIGDENDSAKKIIIIMYPF